MQRYMIQVTRMNNGNYFIEQLENKTGDLYERNGAHKFVPGGNDKELLEVVKAATNEKIIMPMRPDQDA